MLPKHLPVRQTPWAEFKCILEKQRSVREYQTPELGWSIPGEPKTCGKLLKLLSMSKYHGDVVGEQDKEAQPPSRTRLCWGTLWGARGEALSAKRPNFTFSLKDANWPQVVAALEISRVGFRSNKAGLEQLFYKIECVWDQSWYPSLVGQLCIGYAGGAGVSPTCCKWLGVKTQGITVQVCKTVLTALLLVL